MSATSPSPASATTPPPPPSSSNSSAPQSSPSTTTSPPQLSSPPPDSSTSPPQSSPNADPPAPPTSSKPLTPSSQSPPPPPAPPSAPTPASPRPAPSLPATPSPPPSRPPQASPAPPHLPAKAVSPASPPPPSNAPPPSPPPPPPPVVPPESSPPPPSNQPAPSPRKSPANNSSPPPAPSPVQNSPPPTPAAVPPPKNSPPPTPSAAPPPKNSPPTPSAAPPQRNSPPPPVSEPSPRNSPPPPATVPPQSSSPPAVSTPPRNSPPPRQSTPPSSPPPPPSRKVVSPPASQPIPSPSNSTSKISPSPPMGSAAPPSSTSLSPASNSQSPATTPSENGADSSNPSGNTNGGIGTGAMVAISLVAGILVLAFVGIAIWCMRRQKKRPPCKGGYVLPSVPDSPSASDSSFFKTPSSAPPVQSSFGSDSMYTPSEPGGLGNSRSWFTYEELMKATNGFSAQNLLGEGGFGSVYKGCLPDGREIAVKQLKIGGGQGEREFKAEVETISRIHHRHLVSLVGYCIQDSRRLLVYDYAPNNTLYFHLHGEGEPVLDWAKRVRIAAGAARGLAYLHEDCNPRIIHRDIKSSNILLDYHFEARVSDFGLARLALDANTHVTTRVMGTFGYLAPEYASSGKLTEKSDVFSFGVVLLELLTGRKPVDMSQPMGEESLVEWARPLLGHALLNEEFDSLTDPRLDKNYVESEMFRMFEVAAACVRHSSTKRPNMGQVVRAFDSLATSDLTNGMRPGESEVFDSALQSEEIKLFRRMAFGLQDYSTDFFSPPNSNM